MDLAWAASAPPVLGACPWLWLCVASTTLQVLRASAYEPMVAMSKMPSNSAGHERSEVTALRGSLRSVPVLIMEVLSHNDARFCFD